MKKLLTIALLAFGAALNLGRQNYVVDIMFGRDSAGIPEEILKQNKERCVRIPMNEEIRSLNLSNSVAIMLYEALRQQGFKNMELTGNLHHLTWD